MTYIEMVQTIDPSLSEEVCDFILWTHTGFPGFGTIQRIYKQAASYIRATKNGFEPCELCGMKPPYHSHGCLDFRNADER